MRAKSLGPYSLIFMRSGRALASASGLSAGAAAPLQALNPIASHLVSRCRSPSMAKAQAGWSPKALRALARSVFPKKCVSAEGRSREAEGTPLRNIGFASPFHLSQEVPRLFHDLRQGLRREDLGNTDRLPTIQRSSAFPCAPRNYP